VKRILLFTLVACSLTLNATAQLNIVEEVKNELISNRIDLSGPCGAFQITKRVAWRLRAQGAGYIRKTAGQNNCNLHGVDIVMFKDGRIVDILIDAGNSNGPSWDTSKTPVDPSLWQEPEDPYVLIFIPASEPNEPPAIIPPVDFSEVLKKLQDIYDQNERIYHDLVSHDDALAAQLKEHDANPLYLKRLFSNHYVQLLLAGAGTLLTQQLAK
jgi:hypothetical protein